AAWLPRIGAEHLAQGIEISITRDTRHIRPGVRQTDATKRLPGRTPIVRAVEPLRCAPLRAHAREVERKDDADDHRAHADREVRGSVRAREDHERSRAEDRSERERRSDQDLMDDEELHPTFRKATTQCARTRGKSIRRGPRARRRDPRSTRRPLWSTA